MRISKISGSSIVTNADVLICGCGYEDRCIEFAKSMLDRPILKRVVWCFENEGLGNIETYQANKKFFEDNNFQFFYPSRDDKDSHLLSLLNDVKSSNISIVVDYSSMVREWYAYILDYIKKNVFLADRINCYLVYSFSHFMREASRCQIDGIMPMKGYNNLTPPDKPTALIIGLGTEIGIGYYLKEYFDADCVHYFYSENEYVNDITTIHESDLNDVDKSHRHPYRLESPIVTMHNLLDLYRSLESDYRVVIFPCGPKQFTLLSFILHQIIPSINIWKALLSRTYNEKDRIDNQVTMTTVLVTYTK